MRQSHFNKQFFRVLLLFIFVLSHKTGFSFQQADNGLSKSDTASVPKEIEDPENIGINKEASHASLMPYALLASRYC